MMDYIKPYNDYGKDKPEEERAMYHMNCAEVLLRTANDAYDLGLDEDAFKMMTGFGGGFYSGKTCGAFIGSLCALSKKYAKDRPDEQLEAQKGAKLLTEAFEKTFGSMDCECIKPHFRDEVTGCNPVKEKAWEVLQAVIAQMESEKGE